MQENPKTGAKAGSADASTVSMFQQEWQTYRKMVENNFLSHREAYGRLHDLLVNEMQRPFRFLDIACGDASASSAALKGTQVTQYHGIDFSAAALDLARPALAGLGCPVVLEQGDFLELLPGRRAVADVIWIGLSLHHLRGPEKRLFMREIRTALADDGLFLIFENTRREDEDRDGWLRRWDQQKPLWTAYSAAEWASMAAHVHAADFPEADSDWRRFGHEAGFVSVRQLFATPSDLFRLYCFAA